MKTFHKLNFFQKTFLKYTNRTAYITYKKHKRKFQEHERDASMQIKLNQYNNFLKNIKPVTTHPPYSFKHSGNMGDIIYSLPTLITLSKNIPSHLFLHLYQPGIYTREHPLGNVMLDDKVVDMVIPLLKSQKYIASVERYKNQAIDYNLDILRDCPLHLEKGDISRWYVSLFNVFPDLSQPWIHVNPNFSYKEMVIISRTERYNSPHLNYSFLNNYKNLLFVGVEKEYTIMKRVIKNLEYQAVDDFLQLAQIIAGAKFFIGNQSFCFSLAEAMKTPRILEVYYQCPNVIPHGKNGYDVYFQYYFENLVQQLYNS